MSNSPISRNPDLQRLVAEGFELEIVADHLVVRNVPYVNERREIRLGSLVSELNDATGKPDTHIIMFAGEIACDSLGAPLDKIIHQRSGSRIGTDLQIVCTFSSKPPGGYPDYYQKVTSYVRILEHEAQAIDPNANARTWRVIANTDGNSPFHYLDSASSRAGISAVTQKLVCENIGIVGLGGTGSYVLDLVAKTPVRQIHLFDGDKFGQHNAFRSPGAPSLEDLKAIPLKVDYWAGIYGRMHRGIVPHPVKITPDTVSLLQNMDFVFVCADAGTHKQALVEELERRGIPFVDTGMGLGLAEDTLHGMLTVTTSTPAKRDHFRQRVSFVGDGEDNVYARNIQVADLNSLNAAMAVIKWKKLRGFYADLSREHFSNYMIAGNVLLSEDKA